MISSVLYYNNNNNYYYIIGSKIWLIISNKFRNTNIFPFQNGDGFVIFTAIFKTSEKYCFFGRS